LAVTQAILEWRMETPVMTKNFLSAILAVAALLGMTVAHAQDKYPSRPIRLIVPFPAGGPVDVMGRLIGQYLSSALGQQVIIDNRPGAGSTLAAKTVATADPDGYTLLVGSAASLAIGPGLYPNSGYDPTTSFVPIAFLSSVPYTMITRMQAPAKTIPDLIAFAKANPGKLNFGIPNGAPPHMLAVWFRDVTKTDIVIVPYRGAAGAIADLMGAQIDLAFETTSVTLSHIHEGTIRALGVATPRRLPEIPDVPTMIEGGVPEFTASSWTGIMAPAGTPREIVDKLNAAINAGINSAEMKTRFKQLAAIAQPGTPEEFAAFIAEETPKWNRMVKLAGVKPE
jgi:tripartite-type tricarboxylate transporter receptor subunit TctC